MNKLKCNVENAPRFRDWLANRGGLLIWRSVNLSNPGVSWTTPALTDDGEPYPKPTWQADSKPERHITDAAEVVVFVPREVKRFHVAIKRGDGVNITLTDGSSRRLRREVDKVGEGAWYEFSYDTQEAAIFVSDKEIPLNEWQE